MYHRLDGKLVAVGNLDLLQNVLNSGYFIYDPDFKFLNLGVVGALKELEYIRRVRQSQNKYRWYVLGDLVNRCSKVNYKLQYQPGYILCPRTKLAVPFMIAAPSIKLIEASSVEEK
jgi:arginyl-tRNA---protein transferase